MGGGRIFHLNENAMQIGFLSLSCSPVNLRQFSILYKGRSSLANFAQLHTSYYVLGTTKVTTLHAGTVTTTPREQLHAVITLHSYIQEQLLLYVVTTIVTTLHSYVQGKLLL